MVEAGQGTFRCPECGARVAGGADHAEATRECPTCGKAVRFEAVREEAPPPGAQEAPDKCPGCGSFIEPGAGRCNTCGRDLSPAARAARAAQVRPADRFVLALAAGGAAAVVAGAIWAGIVLKTGYEVGWVAWGVGLLTGLAVMKVTPERTGRTGAAAAGLAALGLIIGKLLIFQWGVVPAVAEQMLKDQDFVVTALFEEMLDEGAFDAEMTRWVKNASGKEEPPAHITAKLQAAGKIVGQRLRGMSPAEKKAFCTRKAEEVVARMDYVERIRLQLSPFDALWLLLAVGSAWKLGSGVNVPTAAAKRRASRTRRAPKG